MRKALLAAIVAAAAAFALNSCGLEYITYLEPPAYSSPASPSTPVFIVSNPARDAAEVLIFTGFELYYKFFNANTQTAEQNLQSGLSTRDQLVSTYHFKRMCTAGTQTQVPPFIPVDSADRGSEFDMELDFNPVNTDSPATMVYGGSVPPTYPYGEIRRQATYLSEPKTFAKVKLLQTDDDMTGVNWEGVGQTLNLVVYAISYGVQDYSPVYSSARYLGYMSYYF
jgi:hypothetical protein